MMNHSMSARCSLMIVLIASAFTTLHAQVDDPNVDNTVGMIRPQTGPVPGANSINVVTTPDGYDNFDIGVDFAEPHMSNNPRNPSWWFNAFNTNGTHHTENGHDWSANNPGFPSVSGDPVTAYDSLGNLYYMTMNGPTITGTWVVKSTNNGQSWGPSVASNVGNDKNWIAADQTMGPYANYVYGTMTNSGSGSFTRSTDQGATFAHTWSFSPHALPGMMVAVGPNVLAGNNISGGCVYVVTNSGPSEASTYTFFKSTDGGATFSFASSQNFAGFVGTFYNGRNSVEGVRTRPYPFIAADNSFGPYRGRFYVVYCTNNPLGSGNKPDLYCRYSTDQGTTWSSPVMINDDVNPTANHQWMPAIWCDKETGRLYAKWFDSRRSVNSDSTDVYASYSDNGGVTWAPNQRLTNRTFRTSCTTCGGGGDPRYQGDYTAIASNRHGSMAVWMDYRNGNFGSFTSYFPDFAMTASPAADTLGLTDSINIVVKVPSVKLYSGYVKFSATVSPSANINLSFINNRDSLTTYPDSVVLKVRLNNVSQGVYAVTVTGKGPDGAAIHKRTISISALPALVTVLQPNGGEQMFVGTSYPISWIRNLVDTVRIEYSTNGGSSWNLVTPGVPAKPSTIIHPKLRTHGSDAASENSELALYNWIIPNTPSTNCLIRVSDKNNPSVFDVSNSAFSIAAAPAPRWTTQSAGTTVDFFAVSVIDSSIAWAAGDSGRVYRTVNGGATWFARGNVSDMATSMYALSTNVAFIATNGANGARIVRTNNGGLSWIVAYRDTNPSAYMNAIKMFDTNTGYAIGDPVNGQWTLLRTSSGGTSWTSAGTLAQAGSEFGWGNSMSWIGSQAGWFGTNNSRVYRTTNGGSAWSSSPTSFASSYAVSFASDQLGISGGTGTARSSDGGGTWANTPAQPPGSMFGLVALPGTIERWYAVAGGGVYKSTNHGTTWSSDFSQANTYEAVDMRVVSVGGNTWVTGYAVGDGGTLTKYIELLPATGVSSHGLPPETFVLDQNYPNPFNPSTTISYSLSGQAAVKLSVFDLLGQEVRILVNATQSAGAFDQVWDGLNNAGSQVASGMYYYRLETVSLNGTTHVSDRKMVLLK